jgi:YfiH family protein
VTSAPARPAVLVAGNLARAGFSHGFAMREGGVSEGAFASLNFGAGDEPGRVAENVRRFAAAVGFAPEALRQVTQVHGARVVDARTLESAAAREEADALVLRSPPRPLSHEGRGGGAVGIRVADCVPILIGSSAGVAAVHAGWRGVVAGVIGNAMGMLGAEDAVAAVGPCIGACCFEVGADVAERIAEACGEPRVVVTRAGDKAKVDLRLAVRAQLARVGVRDVEDVPGCTRCEPARFFSYRRDGERSGRHLAAIARAPFAVTRG